MVNNNQDIVSSAASDDINAFIFIEQLLCAGDMLQMDKQNG